MFTASFRVPSGFPQGTAQGGPLVIADFDGDGRAEIGSAGFAGYHVFDPQFDLTRMLVRARRSHAEKTMMARRGETEPEPRASDAMGQADGPVHASFLAGEH